MVYLGDFPASHTAVCIPFDSFAASTGASSATSNFANTDVLIYKDGGTTQRSSSGGITVSTSFDSQTGLQMIVIDLSDNTDAGFYAAGHEYQVAVADITIDSQTVRFWAGAFSIERAGGVLALLKGNAVKVDVNTIKTQAVTCAAGVTVGAFVGNATAALAVDASGRVDVSKVAGTAQTARDLGASVLISSGTGTGQLDVTSGVVKANLAQILGTALTETAGQIAAGFKKFFNIASPASTMDSLTLVATATNLTNAPTAGDFTATMKTSIGTAVAASAVASVTGNVGGNVAGSVGSVTARVTANTDQLAGQTVTAGAGVTFPASVASPTNITSASGVALTSAYDAAKTAAQTGDAMTLTSAYDFAKGTVAMAESYAADGAAPTPAQMLFMLWSLLAERSISDVTLTAKKLDGSTTAMTFTLDDGANPSSQTRAT